MSLEDILTEADRVERDHVAERRRRAEEEASRAVNHIEGALNAALEDLNAYQPNLHRLGNVLQALAGNRPKVNDAHRRRIDRAAAYILSQASVIVDRTYDGPRSKAMKPSPLSEEVKRRPAAPIDDDL